MAKLVYAMNVSLDGYIDHDKFAPGPKLFRHWIEQAATQPDVLYGRKLYELMQYWDGDEWDKDDPADIADLRAFAQAWRRQHKWVVSRVLKSVGPNATLISGDVEAAVHKLKAERTGEIGVGGSVLAQSLGEMGLIDEYQLYYRPFVLGKGVPFFAGAPPKLKFVAHELVGEDAVRVTYAPA